MNIYLKTLLSLMVLFVGMTGIYANQVTIKIFKTNDQSKAIGTVVAVDSKYGLLLTPHLTSLPTGIHGFHVHTMPSCADHGKAAGGHLDPFKTNKHLGPYDTYGHLGDLPVLYVNKQGEANVPVLAPRLKVAGILNHSLMIHAGGDNYSDSPKSLGGGGARIACGVVPKKVDSMSTEG